MSNLNSKVVVLADYAKARALLTLEDARIILNDQKTDIRNLDEEVMNTLSVRHKLKDIQERRIISLRIERTLINTSDWLEDKIEEADNLVQKEAAQRLFKECEQLIGRSERIKKTISDDMAACRYAESKGVLHPAQAIGAIVSISGGAAIFCKTFLEAKLKVAVEAGEVAAFMGTYAAFHRQINSGFVATGRFIAKSPEHVRALNRKARFSAVAASVTIAVAAKPNNEITPRYPLQNTAGSKVVISAKL